MKKALIIDGGSLVQHTYTAFVEKKINPGKNATAIEICKYVSDIMLAEKFDLVFAAYNKSKTTFRNDIYYKYRANRKNVAFDLVRQYYLVQDYFSYLGVQNCESTGYEADDVIGSIVKKLGDDYNVRVYTADTDVIQLITSHVDVVLVSDDLNKEEIYDLKKVVSTFKIMPQQICDVKGLVGDVFDNIPGVGCINFATATAVIAQHGSLEQLLGDNQINNPEVQKVIKNADIAMLSKRLSKIFDKVPIKIDLNLKVVVNLEAINEWCALESLKVLGDKIDALANEYGTTADNTDLNKILEHFQLIGAVKPKKAEFNNDVRCSIENVLEQYGLASGIKLYPAVYSPSFKALKDNIGLKYWNLLGHLAYAGAIIIGKADEGYKIYLPPEISIEEFCKEIERIEMFIN